MMRVLILLLLLASTLSLCHELASQDARVLQRFKEQLLTGPRKVIASGKLEELVIHQVDKRHIIQAKNDCSGQTKKEEAQSCYVEKVEVDFQELGWDFILSPKSLQFSFCRGRCNPQIIRQALATQTASQILSVRNKFNIINLGFVYFIYLFI